MSPQKYKQSEVHPRQLYMVLAGIDDDSAVEGIDIAAARKRYALYFKRKDDAPMDCYVSCYYFMTREFSDVTEEEAEQYLIDDHMEMAPHIPHHNIIPYQEQSALLRSAYPKQEDLELSVLLYARLYADSVEKLHFCP